MSTPPGTEATPPSRRSFRRRQSTPHENLQGLGWGDVLKHAWRHIKESWRVALAGAVVTAVLPLAYQWEDAYHFSESGWDKLTAGGWTASIIGVGVWLVVVALWHLHRAPISHAREVLASSEVRHATEIERVRAQTVPQIVNVQEQHNYFNLGEAPDALANALRHVDVDPASLPRPRNPGRPEERPPAQVDDARADNQTDELAERDKSDD